MDRTDQNGTERVWLDPRFEKTVRRQTKRSYFDQDENEADARKILKKAEIDGYDPNEKDAIDFEVTFYKNMTDYYDKTGEPGNPNPDVWVKIYKRLKEKGADRCPLCDGPIDRCLEDWIDAQKKKHAEKN